MGLAVAAFAGGARVQAAIASAASATGVDFTYLMHQARVESGFDPDARARTSSATGLYQFIEQSWLGVVAKHGTEHGLSWAADAIERGSDGRYRVADPTARAAILDLRRDPQAAATMAAEHAADNRDLLETRLGRGVESVDLYLAHFLGAGGATKFLRGHDAEPDQSAAALFPAAARANRGVFYAPDGSARSLAQVRDRFAQKFLPDPGRWPAQPDGGASPQALRFASAGPSGATRHQFRVGLPPAVQEPAGGGFGPKLVAGRSEAAPHARLAYLMLASLGVS